MGKKYGCRCDGHWATRLEHYVVLRRGLATKDGVQVASAYSELKCRRCHRKWRSRARYVAKLPDGKERTYKKLTDEMTLGLIREGRVRVDKLLGKVYKQKRLAGSNHSRWLDEWIELKQVEDKNYHYLFVDIKYDGHRKWTAVHRLVWMAVNGEIVPEGHDVDHRDRDHHNNAYWNLRLMESRHNQGHNGEWDDVPF